jgi:type VI secretion system protein ImpL
MKPFAILGTASVMALAVAWFAGQLAPAGSDRLILRVGLSLIVLIGAAVIAWYLLQKKKSSTAPAPAKLSSGDQLDLLLREAEAKLASAQRGPGTRICNLPVYLFIGPTGTAKTTVVVESGLEPELLAGEVYADDCIKPTPYLNIWYAKQAVFVEAGESLLNDAASWSRLVKYLAPGRLKSVMGQGGQAPRAAIVCCDAEVLLRQPLETNLTGARNLRLRLSEFASALGIGIPVYALFTKADRIPFFQEFVANLDSPEAAQVFGTILPLGMSAGGTYGEEQTGRLTEAYRLLFYSLAGRRPDYLSRERMLDKTPAIYEFPREFRKMRPAAVPFLVELCRPSQLTIGPFLRGYYLCGVRPIFVQERAPAPAQQRPATRKAFQAEIEATRMFRPQADRELEPAVDLVGSHEAQRKVPQWVFLTSFFTDVLLADFVALGTSGSSAKTNLARRWLLGIAASVCLLLSIAFIVSYTQNHDLETTAINAAEAIQSPEAAATGLPSLTALKHLETLRQSLERLAAYDRNGPPLGLRWGLYSGDGLYPYVRNLYFQKFQQILLIPIQKAWVDNLKSLPPSPSPKDSYERTYDALKGYLITTSHHEKSSRQFLAPLLASRWAEGQQPGSDRTSLAQKQFDFYSDELKLKNPFSTGPEDLAVKRARAYLSQFAGAERVYQSMLAEANMAEKPINFNRDIKSSADEVINNKDVPGAFTKGGWSRMQNSMKNIDRYFNGERWVLGDGQGNLAIDRATLDQELRKLYYRDFIRSWRDFLDRSVVVPYKNVKDAATKLNATSNSQSPLLALFNVASQNTAAVDAPDVQKAFKPLYAVMPPSNVDQYVGPTNSDYMRDLVGLQVSLEEIAGDPGTPNETSVAKTLDLARNAKLKTRQMAQAFGIDNEGHLDHKMQQLLEDPITHVEEMFRSMGPADLNRKGQGFCSEMKLLTDKYPFNPKATVQASIADVNAIFQPKEGALWKFYDANLQKLLVPQGSQYVAGSGGVVQLTPQFVGFFNRAAGFSKALYPEGAVPHLTFKMKPVKIEGIDAVAIQFNGQTLAFNGYGESKQVSFTWPEGANEVKATTTPPIDWFNEAGLWAIYEFLTNADRVEQVGSITHLEYDVVVRIGGSNGRPRPSGPRRVVSFDLDMGANPPIFQKGYLSRLACVAEVAK